QYELFGTSDNLQNFLIFLQIASTIVAYGLFKGLSGFFSSRVSSKLKRKNTMRIGLALLAAGSLALAFASYLKLTGLIIGNIFIGGGLGFFFTASMSALTDIAGSEGSAFSLGTMEFSVYMGSSLGAFFAGLISDNQDGFAASFIFALIVAGVALLVGFFLLKNVETTELVKGSKEEILFDSTKVETQWKFSNIVRTPTLLLTYLAGHFSRIMDSLIVLLLPIMLVTAYGFSYTQIGLVTSAFTLAWSISMPLTGRLSDRFGRKEATIFGLFTEGLAIGLITIANSFTFVLILMIIAGIGTAVYYPSLPSITRDVVPIVKREQSLGIYRASLDSGYFTGPLIAIGLVFSASSLAIWGPATSNNIDNMLRFPFLVIAVILGLLAISFLIFATETRPGWVQASISLKHGKKVRDAFRMLKQAFDSYVEGESPEACADLLGEAKELEREADKLVMKVTRALYGSVRPAPDDYHFYKITEILDSSIGFLLRSYRKLLLIPRKKLSVEFIEYLNDETNLLLQLITKAIEVLEVVCIQPLASHPIFDDVHLLENALDKNSHRGLATILKKTDKLNTVEILFLDQIVEALELSANTIEDAVDVMKIIGLKYQISPLRI
ncbi:MAG: MFS transporter, partial [Candidatus Heimdallarchaeaceae archaeon]